MDVSPHDLPTGSLSARARIVRLFIAGIGAAALATSPALAGPPAGFSITTIASGFELPTAHAYADDGRLFVAEKSGRVFVQQPGFGGLRTTFLDLRDWVNDYGERGLTGLALDRNFATNRRMYLSYVAEKPGSTPDSSDTSVGRVVRVEGSAADPNIEDPSKRTVLLDGFEAAAPNHVTGTVRVDAQNRVLAGFGDGNRDITAVQRLDQLNGKIVRINASTGAGVPGNPYYDATNPTSIRSKVLAYGLRNPFRFTVDEPSGDVWVGDVGQNTWEELNVIPASWTNADRELNFGWPCFEGANGTPSVYPGAAAWSGLAATCSGLPGTAASRYAYNHSDSSAGSSITGGPVYRGQLYPSSYVGRVFFADYARNRFHTYTPGGTTTDFGTSGDWGNPVDIVPDPSGDISYVAIGEGEVRTIVYSGSNHAPLISSFSATPTSGQPPMLVHFSASASDFDADILTYRWSFGDGSPVVTGRTTEHVYSTPGSFDATLTVSDGRAGGTITKVTRIDAGNNVPTVAIRLASGPTYRVGQAIAIRLQAFDPEDGALSDASVTWRVSRIHLAHSHPVTSGKGVTGSLFVDDHGDDPGYLEIVARATDRYGSSAQTSVRLDAERVVVQLTSPSVGTIVNIDGEDHSTPYRLSSIIGGSHRIVAPALNKKGQAFSNWQIFGRSAAARENEFTTPGSDGTVAVRYATPGDAARGANAVSGSGAKATGSQKVRLKTARGRGWLAATVTARVDGMMTVAFRVGNVRLGTCLGRHIRANRPATCRIESEHVGRGDVHATAVVRTAAGRNLRTRVLLASSPSERSATSRGRRQ